MKDHAFCPTCGSPVYLAFPAMTDLFTIHAASLDQPERYAPAMTFFTASGFAWDPVPPGHQAFAGMPTS